MENASKALLISAAVLIAVMILALMTRLFRSALGVVSSYDTQMETIATTEFNNRFAKYVAGGYDGREVATIYDIVSLADFAYEYNSKMVVDPKNIDRSREPAIVQIDIENFNGDDVKIANLQNHSEIYNELLKNCYYVNLDAPNANSIITFKVHKIENNAVGRVNYVTFQADKNIDDRLNSIIPLMVH